MKTELKPHPLGAIFPPMTDQEYSDLVKGMKKNGFDPKHPIVLHEGMILDGNHRYTAALKCKIKPPTVNLPDSVDPFEYVIQENLRRRNLTPSQAAAVGADLVMKMKEADKAARAAEKAARKEAKKNGKERPKKSTKARGLKAAKAAKMMNVSTRSVEGAVAVRKADPEKFAEVKAGKKSVKTASREIEQEKTAKQRKTEEHSRICRVIDEAAGPDFTKLMEEKLSGKDFSALAGLDAEEIKRVKPLLEIGWKLKDAVGYKSTQITPRHPIQTVIDACVANRGSFTDEIELYGKKFGIGVTEVA